MCAFFLDSGSPFSTRHSYVRLERAERPRPAVATRPHEAGRSMGEGPRRHGSSGAARCALSHAIRTTVAAGDRQPRAIQPSRRGCMALHCPIYMHEVALHRPVCMHEVAPFPGASPLACTAGSSSVGPVQSSPVQSSPVQSSPVRSSPVQSSPVQSRPVLSCPVLSCPVLSCPVLSCPVLSCPVLSCPVLSSPVNSSRQGRHPRRLRLSPSTCQTPLGLATCSPPCPP